MQTARFYQSQGRLRFVASCVQDNPHGLRRGHESTETAAALATRTCRAIRGWRHANRWHGLLCSANVQLASFLREFLRYGPVSRPAHLRSELRVNRDSPARHGRETVPQHAWFIYLVAAEGRAKLTLSHPCGVRALSGRSPQQAASDCWLQGYRDLHHGLGRRRSGLHFPRRQYFSQWAAATVQSRADEDPPQYRCVCRSRIPRWPLGEYL